MSDKERLENMSPIGFDLNGNILLKSEDYHWLMEQAERVEELEKEVEKQKNRKYIKMRQRDDFMKKAQHYKQALEEILNADCNLEGLDAERELDRVTDIALKALEVTEK